ncbi:THTR-like protein [Mya arenaria]|uniref:THTR-like protein n=1 Tax=Mya arenaria TaxID=6604 RepID=A0ABY7FDA0_MYAAR|nr:THTR-like protein [Mya arenaria]
MSLARVRTIVSTNWLKEQISTRTKPSRQLRILDTAFSFDRDVDSYKDGYQRGHIPQSLHFNIFQCTQSTPEISVNLPDLNCFTEYVRDLGIWPDTHVVTYHHDLPLSAFRTWWMFRLFGHRNISVLDGGITKWQKDGYEITTDEPIIERSDFVAKMDKSLLRNYEDVIRNYKTKEEQIVEARVKDHPTRIDVFDAAGVDVAKPMFVTCLRGMTACGTAAAARILGKDDVPIYYVHV